MYLDNNLRQGRFGDINLDDPFFDSLKTAYSEFIGWFESKEEELAYFMTDDDGGMQAFLYLKEESGEITDVEPPLPNDLYLKMGTFKINAHGTKLGERFIKKTFDHALNKGIKNIYVTLFPEHEGLIEVLNRVGFQEVAEKITVNGIEKVLLKRIGNISGEVEADYPLIKLSGRQYLLGIYPEYHTRLFPDSILNNEDAQILDDVSHTNSIKKIYICRMEDVQNLVRGDALVIYRTTDQPNRAWYRAVATSLCMVEEVKSKQDFSSLDNFLQYCLSRSVFSATELTRYFNTWPRLYVIKMTYNAALYNRIIRQRLAQEVGLDAERYWGFMDITSEQFRDIASLGGVDDSIIVD